MGAGILEIINTGFTDKFLTKEPQITFFKIVFLRYTPFAIETVEEFFDGDANFNNNISCNLSKCGDLINKLWIRIDLPTVAIPILASSALNPNNKSSILTSINKDLTAAQILYTSFQKFMSYVFELWRDLIADVTSSAGTYTTVSNIINNFTSSDVWNQYVLFNIQFTNVVVNIDTVNFDLVNIFNNNYKTQYSYSIYSPAQTTLFKTNLYNELLIIKTQSNNYNEILFNNITKLKSRLAIESRTNYRFSWVQKIGFALIEQCTIDIGGQIIDRLNSDLLNIWYELCLNTNQTKIFNNLIGDVSLLTTFSTNTPYYTLYIPLPFWFCRHNGVALPAVALRYHDIIINVKFRQLSDCCYFENTTDDININELINLAYVSLYVDYIYIDQPEREKFGQKQLEYLIEEHQTISFNNSPNTIINNILTFVNPVKELYWVLQSKKNIKLWNNYSLPTQYSFSIVQNNNNMVLIVGTFNFNVKDLVVIDQSLYYSGTYTIYAVNNIGVIINIPYITSDTGIIYKSAQQNTIDTATLTCNGIQIIDNMYAEFYNNMVPYKYHTGTPDKGIYNYSFSLHPEDFQPFGSLNLGLVSSVELYNTLTIDFYTYLLDNRDTVITKIFAKSYNILKITKGMASLEWSI
jgi:hypothetical protein